MFGRSKTLQLLAVGLSLALIAAATAQVYGQEDTAGDSTDDVPTSQFDVVSQVFLPAIQGGAEADSEPETVASEELATPVDAQVGPAAYIPAVWTHVAAACVPDEGSMSRFEANAARFRHKSTSTGSIYARCNVTNPADSGGGPTWSALEVVYLDPPTGTPTDTNQITAELWRVSNSSGGVYRVALFDSNGLGRVARTTAQSGYTIFSHAFDFRNYAYYVQLKVSRVTTSTVPEVYIVRLEESIQ